MVFGQRQKDKLLTRLKSWFWPRSGWKRSSQYLVYRLTRIPGTAYSIAAGFACGAAISFTPFVGFHIILAAILAYLMRANILASAIGTVVGNPWTFPFIWVWLFESGKWMLYDNHTITHERPHFHAIFNQLGDAMLRYDFQTMVDVVSPVVWPMFVSSIPTAIIVWIAIYFPLAKVIHGYQQTRIRRLQRQAEKNAESELSDGNN